MKQSRLRFILFCILVLFAFGLFYIYKSSFFSQYFSQSHIGAPIADNAKIIHLKDGDTYDMTVSIVTKEINGKKIQMMAYNGSVPGPFISVEKGAKITLKLTNNLPLDTTLHSHGLRGDVMFDGMPDVSQKPIKPHEAFVYKLKFPDSGTYWYHPHIREDYTQMLGLYGMYDVSYPTGELQPTNEELHFTLSDILFENGNVVPFFKKKTNFAIMGRFGNVMLINGNTSYTKALSAGSVVRMQIVNSANARPFDLTVANAKIKLVGSDMGLYEKETFVDHLVIGPAERYTIDVLFPIKGTYRLVHTSHDRTVGEKIYTLATFTVTDPSVAVSYAQEFFTAKSHAYVTAEMAPIRALEQNAPDKKLRIDLSTGSIDLASSMNTMPCHMMSNGTWMGACTDDAKQKYLSGAVTNPMMSLETIHWEDHIYKVNKTATSDDISWQLIDQDSEKINTKIDTWHFTKGQRVKVRIYNDPNTPHPMQHPIHFHGQRFAVTAINAKPITNLVWKDTIMIPAGDTVDIIIEMTNPGEWMAHCHIAEHLGTGMMFHFTVRETTESTVPALHTNH